MLFGFLFSVVLLLISAIILTVFMECNIISLVFDFNSLSPCIIQIHTFRISKE